MLVLMLLSYSLQVSRWLPVCLSCPSQHACALLTPRSNCRRRGRQLEHGYRPLTTSWLLPGTTCLGLLVFFGLPVVTGMIAYTYGRSIILNMTMQEGLAWALALYRTWLMADVLYTFENAIASGKVGCTHPTMMQ